MTPDSIQITQYNEWLANLKPTNVNRVTIINSLIDTMQYTKYLEIGVRFGNCFKKIKIDHKDGVDPVFSEYTNFNMTSDKFFEELDNSIKYDIIFIDGLHHADQVYKDINNALSHLSKNGIIVCHDMNPQFEICQRLTSVVRTWNGDCWKAFVKLRSERTDLDMYTIATDHGIGLIHIGHQQTIDIPTPLTYDYLEENRQLALNLIQPEEFSSLLLKIKESL